MRKMIPYEDYQALENKVAELVLQVEDLTTRVEALEEIVKKFPR